MNWNRCRRMRELFMEAAYDEISPGNRAELESHLRDCTSCSTAFSEMKETLKIMGQKAVQDPGEEYWSGYFARLQQRRKRAEQPVVIRRGVQRKWILQAAAAVALVLAGFLLGRIYFRQPPPNGNMTQARPLPSVPVQRANHFLQRSQVLLLGIVNSDPDAPLDSSALAQQRQVSKGLVREASTLTQQLNDPRDRRLRQLVSDLEVILLQIANLQEQGQMQGVEIVKSGVDRKGILLKIDLEQMRQSAQSGPPVSRKARNGI